MLQTEHHLKKAMDDTPTQWSPTLQDATPCKGCGRARMKMLPCLRMSIIGTEREPFGEYCRECSAKFASLTPAMREAWSEEVAERHHHWMMAGIACG